MCICWYWNDGSSFLKIGITFVSLSMSGNMPVFMTWCVSTVNDLMIVGYIIFKSFEEIPSQPLLFFVGRLSMVFFTVSSSTLFKLKT